MAAVDTETTCPSRVTKVSTIQACPPCQSLRGSFLRAASQALHALCRSLAKSDLSISQMPMAAMSIEPNPTTTANKMLSPREYSAAMAPRSSGNIAMAI